MKIKKLFIIIFSITVFILSVSCENISDERFITDMSSGLNSRWSYQSSVDEDKFNKESMEKCLYKEYEAVKKYKDMTFKNKELYVWVNKYIVSLEDSIEYLSFYGTDEWTSKYLNGTYNDRVESIYAINKLSDLTIEDDNLSSFADVNRDGEIVYNVRKWLNSVEFTEEKDDFDGVFRYYSSIVENTSSINFSYFDFTVSLISDGIIVDTVTASVDSWNSGDKIKFEFYSEKSFDEMDVKYASWIER